MAKLVLGAFGLVLVYVLLTRTGSAEAAVWLTGGVGCIGLIWLGLARA